jgi:aldehyde:ferredoxin oxidoreductase
MPFGYNGKILRIDLKKESIEIEQPDDTFYRTYWGGRGFGLYYMLKEMKPKTDPFSGDNLLIFSTSVILGNLAPAMPRYTICSKSPLTGAEGESEAGGYWGPELKKAGYDAIIIRGIAQNPCYLWIKDGEVEFKDASHLWGKETHQVDELIKKELGEKNIRICQIGLGGENQVLFANIVNELTHFNGRNGLGAVMGSKRLKAIVVKGTRTISLYDKEKVKEIAKDIGQRVLKNPLSSGLRKYGTPAGVRAYYESGSLPSLNWTTGYFEKGENLTAEVYNQTILKKRDSCYACPIRCKRVVEVKDKKLEVDPVYGGPEYETVVTMGSLCGIDDLKYVAKANELCNKWGIDTISTGMVIAFAMQCYEERILTKQDTDGLDLHFGNKEAVLPLIEKIANKDGFGKLLAQGSRIASRMIGKGSEKFLREVKGQEIAMHDPRVKASLALQFAFSDYGSDHMKAPHDTLFSHENSPGLQEMSGLGILRPLDPTDLSYRKVALFKILDIYWTLFDILGICYFGYVPRSVGTMDELLAIIRATTGWKTTWYELMKLGERTINMARMYNIREGFNADDDTVPEIFFTNFTEGPLKGKGALNRKDFEEAKQLRYELMGWNPRGEPTRGKLIELDLDWLTEEIERHL